MAREPAEIRAITFFDGQNLFHCAKAPFGHVYPNYDPVALSNAVCVSKGWRCAQVRFYTGVPDAADNAFWNHFWVAMGAQMGREGVHVCTRPLSGIEISRLSCQMAASTHSSTATKRVLMFASRSTSFAWPTRMPTM